MAIPWFVPGAVITQALVPITMPYGLTRYRLYLALQAAGWGGLTALLLLYDWLIERESLTAQVFTVAVVYGASGAILTDVYRRKIHIYDWGRLPLGALAWRVILASLALALAHTAILTVVGLLWQVGTPPAQIVWVNVLATLANGALLFLIWSMIYFMMKALAASRREEIERLRTERNLRESELGRLRSQMNPHFVFNALNSVRALIHEDPTGAEQAITRLSQLMRLFMASDQDQTTTLEEELRTIRIYLELEKIRYEDRLRYRIETEPGVLEARVPTLAIQTLVENALKHGIAARLEGGEIFVQATANEGRLYVRILNPGYLPSTGLDEASPQPGGKPSYGIDNTRRRLGLIYGAQAGLSIRGIPMAGLVEARLWVPLARAGIPTSSDPSSGFAADQTTATLGATPRA